MRPQRENMVVGQKPAPLHTLAAGDENAVAGASFRHVRCSAAASDPCAVVSFTSTVTPPFAKGFAPVFARSVTTFTAASEPAAPMALAVPSPKAVEAVGDALMLSDGSGISSLHRGDTHPGNPGKRLQALEPSPPALLNGAWRDAPRSTAQRRPATREAAESEGICTRPYTPMLGSERTQLTGRPGAGEGAAGLASWRA